MRRILPVVLLAVPLMLLVAAPQDPARKKGMPAPKNLKILPPDTDLFAVMGSYRVALGQQCTFCHVQGDFASDENPKKITARHMIQMVNDINAKFPDGKVHVSCYTCHRGATLPLMAPPTAGGGF
jgi:photosynthetic reaction center cytochrome c subunit